MASWAISSKALGIMWGGVGPCKCGEGSVRAYVQGKGVDYSSLQSRRNGAGSCYRQHFIAVEMQANHGRLEGESALVAPSASATSAAVAVAKSPAVVSRRDCPLWQRWDGQQTETVMPVMPGTRIEQSRGSVLYRCRHGLLAVSREHETHIVPGSEEIFRWLRFHGQTHIYSVKLNMRAPPANPDREQLFEIAESQQGYFTAAQAAECGFARSTHSYHVQNGNWVREHRGIYRLKRFPQSDHGQLVLWSLWSRDRNGVPKGVYSHLTALSTKELSDANPAKLHMTVPPDFRRSGEPPPVLILPKARLSPEEILHERGFDVTTPMKAIIDAAASGDASRDIIQQAISAGKSRGLITRREISAALGAPDLDLWLRKLLQAA